MTTRQFISIPDSVGNYSPWMPFNEATFNPIPDGAIIKTVTTGHSIDVYIIKRGQPIQENIRLIGNTRRQICGDTVSVIQLNGRAVLIMDLTE